MVLETLFNRRGFCFLLLRLRLDAFEELREFSQRIIAANVAIEFAPVVNQIERDLQLALFDAIERFDLARVDDGRIKSCRDCFVQKHRVEHDSRCRIQSE